VHCLHLAKRKLDRLNETLRVGSEALVSEADGMAADERLQRCGQRVRAGRGMDAPLTSTGMTRLPCLSAVSISILTKSSGLSSRLAPLSSLRRASHCQ
jgi:hypothetical protein